MVWARASVLAPKARHEGAAHIPDGKSVDTVGGGDYFV